MKDGADKKRLDVAVVERGLAETRARAQALIMGGGISVDGTVVTKPSTPAPAEATIELVSEPLPFVSRGGMKLAHALESFNLNTQDVVAIDVGASTGGFTDVLLQLGAKRVYAIDVGYGQLAWKLRQDPRVIVMERTNIRSVESLPELADVATIDVSFISLLQVLPVVRPLLKPSGRVVGLIKPQFEAGPKQVARGGVVRDPEVRKQVLRHVAASAIDAGWSIGGLVPSPIKGPAGNVEFLILLSLSTDAELPALQERIEEVGSAAVWRPVATLRRESAFAPSALRLPVLQNVAIFYHPRRAEAVSQAEWLATAFQSAGVPAVLGNGWDPELVTELGCGKDLLIAFGGDGTILQVARLSPRCDAPILGINLGRVGFLAEMTPDTLPQHVDRLVNGEFWIENRLLLDVAYQSSAGAEQFVSLNEVAVSRGTSPQAVHVNAAVDGDEFLSYTADAVLVATATGSTAYSLAAGGPIMYPEAMDFMITPVAPHLHIGRSTILPGESKVTLTLASDRSAVMSVDGTHERILEPGQSVEVSRSQSVARFARLGSRTYFYTALQERLR